MDERKGRLSERYRPDGYCKAMVEFILSHGERIDFAKFMQESLYAESRGQSYGGFYNDRVEISDVNKEADFLTDSNFLDFAKGVYNWLKINGKDKSVFLELGGGMGDFKKNIQQFRKMDGQSSAPYFSLEVSSKLSILQKQAEELGAPSKTVRGSAYSIPFATDSFEGVCFSNELLDAMPARGFKIKALSTGIKIEKELFIEPEEITYQNQSSGITYKFYDLENVDDPFVNLVEEYLNTLSIDQQAELLADPDFVWCYAEGHVKLVLELKRIFRAGQILLMDYGTCAGNRKAKRNQPYFIDTKEFRGVAVGLDYIIKSPYMNDITYFVDFEFLSFLFKKYFPGSDVLLIDTNEFFAKIEDATKSSEGKKAYSVVSSNLTLQVNVKSNGQL